MQARISINLFTSKTFGKNISSHRLGQPFYRQDLQSVHGEKLAKAMMEPESNGKKWLKLCLPDNMANISSSSYFVKNHICL
jgi:hypothetical protein